MNEAETRAELIDPLLAAAGWGVAGGPQRWVGWTSYRRPACLHQPGD